MGELNDHQQIQQGQRIRVIRRTDLAVYRNGEWDNPMARVVIEPAGTVREGIVTLAWPAEDCMIPNSADHLRKAGWFGGAARSSKKSLL